MTSIIIIIIILMMMIIIIIIIVIIIIIIIVFFPRAGLSLQTQHSPLYPLLSLPFRIFIQSIYHNVVYHLSSSTSNFLPIYHIF